MGGRLEVGCSFFFFFLSLTSNLEGGENERKGRWGMDQEIGCLGRGMVHRRLRVGRDFCRRIVFERRLSADEADGCYSPRTLQADRKAWKDFRKEGEEGERKVGCLQIVRFLGADWSGV